MHEKIIALAPGVNAHDIQAAAWPQDGRADACTPCPHWRGNVDVVLSFNPRVDCLETCCSCLKTAWVERKISKSEFAASPTSGDKDEPVFESIFWRWFSLFFFFHFDTP